MVLDCRQAKGSSFSRARAMPHALTSPPQSIPWLCSHPAACQPHTPNAHVRAWVMRNGADLSSPEHFKRFPTQSLH